MLSGFKTALQWQTSAEGLERGPGSGPLLVVSSYSNTDGFKYWYSMITCKVMDCHTSNDFFYMEMMSVSNCELTIPILLLHLKIP